MDLGKKYSGAAPAAPWPGGAVFTAVGPAGEKVFVRELSGEEDGAAPFLSHPNLPVYVETVSVPGDGGRGEFAVYEHFDGESLAAIMAAGGTFTEFEALSIGYETARALKYLHGLSPRVAHGAVSSSSVFRGKGGRVYLCGRAPDGSHGDDIEGLAGLMRALSGAPKRGRFSGGYWKMLEYLELPGAEAGRALKTIESVGAYPIAQLKSPVPDPARRKLPKYAWPAAVAVFLLVFFSALKFRFEVLPEMRAKKRVEAAARPGAAGEFPCSGAPEKAEPRLGENLLSNPGLEGPCGWTMLPDFKSGAIKKGGARSGDYCFVIKDPETVIYQEADVSAFAENIAGRRCRVELSGYLRAGSFGGDGDPYLYGYAMRSAADHTYLSLCRPVKATEWTRSRCEFALPAGTQRVRIMLQASSVKGAVFSKEAYFDDLSVKVECAQGRTGRTKISPLVPRAAGR